MSQRERIQSAHSRTQVQIAVAAKVAKSDAGGQSFQSQPREMLKWRSTHKHCSVRGDPLTPVNIPTIRLAAQVCCRDESTQNSPPLQQLILSSLRQPTRSEVLSSRREVRGGGRSTTATADQSISRRYRKGILAALTLLAEKNGGLQQGVSPPHRKKSFCPAHYELDCNLVTPRKRTIHVYCCRKATRVRSLLK